MMKQTFKNHRTRVYLALVSGVLTVSAVAVIAILVGTVSKPAPVQASITIEEIINHVEIEMPRQGDLPGNDYVTAEIGLALQPGDGVKTHSESEARVDVTIGDTVRFMRTTPNTLWRVGQFEVNEGAVIELYGGKVLLFDEETPEGRPPMKVITPAGTATARGTWMSVEFDPASGETSLSCYRGTCELENEFGIEILRDDQKSLVIENAAPLAPALMTFEDAEEFITIPEAIEGIVPIPAKADIQLAADVDVRDTNSPFIAPEFDDTFSDQEVDSDATVVSESTLPSNGAELTDSTPQLVEDVEDIVVAQDVAPANISPSSKSSASALNKAVDDGDQSKTERRAKKRKNNNNDASTPRLATNLSAKDDTPTKDSDSRERGASAVNTDIKNNEQARFERHIEVGETPLTAKSEENLDLNPDGRPLQPAGSVASVQAAANGSGKETVSQNSRLSEIAAAFSEDFVGLSSDPLEEVRKAQNPNSGNDNGKNLVLAQSSDSDIVDAHNQSSRTLAFVPETTDEDVVSKSTSNRGNSSEANGNSSLRNQLASISLGISENDLESRSNRDKKNKAESDSSANEVSSSSGDESDSANTQDSSNGNSGNSDQGNSESSSSANGNGNSGNGNSGNSDQGNSEPSSSDNDNSNDNSNSNGNGNSGNGNSGNNDQGNSEPSSSDNDNSNDNSNSNGNGNSGNGNSGNSDQSTSNSSSSDNDSSDNGNDNSGNSDQGNSDSGSSENDSSDNGNGNSGNGNSNGNSGNSDQSTSDSSSSDNDSSDNGNDNSGNSDQGNSDSSSSDNDSSDNGNGNGNGNSESSSSDNDNSNSNDNGNGNSGNSDQGNSDSSSSDNDSSDNGNGNSNSNGNGNGNGKNK